MDSANLTLRIETQGMEQAQAKMAGVSRSAAYLQAQVDKMRIAGDELGAGTEKMVSKQDAFLQSLDMQAATMGKGAAAMRLYKAEQLGLADDTVFKNLNSQLIDIESNTQKTSRSMGLMGGIIERSMLRMAFMAVAIKGVAWAYDELVNGADKWMALENKITENTAKNDLATSSLMKSIHDEMDGFKEGTSLAGGYNGTLARQGVLRAEMMAMGPEYRNAIYQENGHWSDQLIILKQINAEHLKQTQNQIDMMEANKPSGSVLGHVATGLMGSMPSIGGLLLGAGTRSDVEEMDKYNTELNKLYKSKADLMKSTAELSGYYDKETKSLNDLYEVNHRIYKLDQEMHPLGAGKKVPDSLISPATHNKATDAFSFKPLVDYDTMMQKDLKLRAQAGDTWAIIGETVVENSRNATSAMADWLDGTDGLSKSWTTLGDTVRNVIADMLKQMERAIIQQQLMSPLMNYLGIAIGSFTGGSGSTGTSYGTGTGWSSGGGVGAGGFTGNLGLASAGGGPAQTVIVNVNHQGDSSVSSSGSSSQNLAAIGKLIGGQVKGILIDESRPGGLLNRRN